MHRETLLLMMPMMLFIVEAICQDGWSYAGMHNTGMGLAAVANCAVCPVTAAV